MEENWRKDGGRLKEKEANVERYKFKIESS